MAIAASMQAGRRHGFQVSVLGSAEPGTTAYERAGEAGEALALMGLTLVSGCGSPDTRVAAERAWRETRTRGTPTPSSDAVSESIPCAKP